MEEFCKYIWMELISLKTRLLEEMTWVEAEKALKSCEVLVLPIGSVEQHGPGLPLGTDMMVANALGKAIAQKTDEDVVVLPTFSFGYCDYHSDFAGTLSLREDTLTRMVSEILDYALRWGPKKVFFVNSHGANMPALRTVSHRLRAKNIATAMVVWWDIAVAINPAWGLIGHADINEVSFMLAIRPELVNMNEVKNGAVCKLTENITVKNLYNVDYKGANISMGLRTRDVTPYGAMLETGFEGTEAVENADVMHATAQRGHDMIEGISDFLVGFIRDFKKMSFFEVNFPEDQFMTRK